MVLDSYTDYLDFLTNDLKKTFPPGGKSWGAARKGLNLFFRDVVYNKYLADYLNIPSGYKANHKALCQLEIPLDGDVAKELNRLFDDLPKWHSIKNLKKNQSDLYQDKAKSYANSLGIARVHLDLEFWRNNR